MSSVDGGRILVERGGGGLGSEISGGLAGEVRSRKIAMIDRRSPYTETGLACRPLHGGAPQTPSGLDPTVVAHWTVDAIEGAEREVAAASFAA